MLLSIVDHLYIVGPVLVGIAALAAWGWRSWLSTEAGRRRLDRVRERLPYLGELARIVTAAQLARSLSTLLAGGTPLVEALRTGASSLTNQLYLDRLELATKQVTEGSGLAQAVRVSVSARRGKENRSRAGYFAYFSDPANAVRTAMSFVAEVGREIGQSTRARLTDRRPRVGRGGLYPFVRAFATVATGQLDVDRRGVPRGQPQMVERLAAPQLVGRRIERETRPPHHAQTPCRSVHQRASDRFRRPPPAPRDAP